jgi:predicted dehydrogenase
MTPTNPPLVRWGILGPGAIARRFFLSAIGSATGQITAIGTRDPSRGELAQHFPGVRVHGSYDALLADPDVDAVYIATPQSLHRDWAIRASQLGKHVLCEKPMALSSEDVIAMFDAAEANGVFLGEAFMYRQHPLTQAIADLVASGCLGRIKLVRSSFGLAVPEPATSHRLLSKPLGGGAILEVGGYPVSVAMLIVGIQNGGSAPLPLSISATGLVGSTGVDEYASAILQFEGDVFAELSVSITLRQDNMLHVVGTAGRIEVDHFWVGTGVEGGTKTIRFFGSDGANEVISITEESYLYAFQFEAANAAIGSGRGDFTPPGMTQADSIVNAGILDAWRNAVHAGPVEVIQHDALSEDGADQRAGDRRDADSGGVGTPGENASSVETV